MTCRHRFIIPTPKGATVSAACLKCGTRKTWRTSLEDRKTGWRAAAAARLKEKVT